MRLEEKYGEIHWKVIRLEQAGFEVKRIILKSGTTIHVLTAREYNGQVVSIQEPKTITLAPGTDMSYELLGIPATIADMTPDYAFELEVKKGG